MCVSYELAALDSGVTSNPGHSVLRRVFHPLPVFSCCSFSLEFFLTLSLNRSRKMPLVEVLRAVEIVLRQSMHY